MNKLSSKLIIKKTKWIAILTCTVLILSPILFISCENFLNGGDIKNEIEETIAYNNAQECTVVFRADSGTGEFLGSVERIYKVGYESDVQFELNTDDYKFKGLEAVSQNDKLISRSDCVEFTPISIDEKKGIFKYKIKLLKDVKDILIHPVCILRPKISEISPKFESSGCDQDTPIIIKFNKSIDSESFKPEYISIYAEDNLSEYFYDPQFTSDNKSIFINAKKGKLILPPDGTRSIANIEVSYDFFNMKDIDGLDLIMQGTHTYKINKNFGNQKKVMVQIPSNIVTGSFLSAGENECTVGYTIDLQFTLNKSNYRFVSFEAVSSFNSSISRNDCISIENEDYDDENGIYRAKVRVIKDMNDICILPVCEELPYVVSYSPTSSSELNYTNTDIIITLSKAIDSSTLDGNISIISNNIDKSELFDSPVLNEQNTIIVIKPKMQVLKNYISNLGASFLDFQISLSDKVFASARGITLPLKQDEKSTFTVRYKPQIDTTLPERRDFIATREPVTIASAKNLSAENKFLLQTFGREYDKLKQNFTNGAFYIYGKYYDKNKAIKNIVVEKRNNGDPIKTVFDVDSEDIEFTYDDNGITEFCLKYVIESKYESSFTVSCYVTDELDCQSIPVQFTVYVDPLNLSNILFYNFEYEEMEDGEFDIDWYKDNYKSIKISYNPDFVDDGAFEGGLSYLLDDDYTNYCEYFDSYLFECEYKDDEGQIHHEIMQNNKEKMYFYCNLQNVESVNGLKFKLFVTDFIQTQSEIELQFPVVSVISNLRTSGNNAYITFAPGNPIENDNMKRHEFLLEEYNDNYNLTNIWAEGENTENQINKSSSYKYYTIPGYRSNNDYVYLCGDISTQLNIENMTNTIPDVQLDGNPTYKKGTSWFGGTSVGYIDMMDITVNIQEDSWNTFDRIYIEYENDYNSSEIQYYKNSECSLTFKKRISKMYTKDTNITVYGIIGNSRSSGTVCTINQFESNSTCGYDYMKPSLEVTRIDYDYIKVQLTDNESGPDYGYVLDLMKNGDYKYKLSRSNNWTVQVPVWELLDVRDTSEWGYTIQAEGYDKYGNMDDVNNVTALWGYVQSDLKWHYKYISGVGTSTFTFDTRHSELINLYTFNTNNCEWELDQERVQRSTYGTSPLDGYRYYRFRYENAPTNSFIRMVGITSITFDFDDNRSCPCYFYTGTQNSGDYDLLIPNGGNSPTEFAVSSDSAVFVHTIVTKRPECKDWSVYDWEDFRKHIGEKQFSFSSTDHGPKRYKVPVDEIEKGEYYTVIAHFADGSVTMSEVLQK